MNRVALVLVALLVPSIVGTQQFLDSRTLLATVTDTGNRALFDLGPDDFVVDEHGESREVLAVNVADYPIAVLLDNSGPAAPQLEEIRAAALGFIARTGDRPIAVGGLAAPARLAASLSDNRAAVLAAVEQLTPGQGGPLPLQAAANAARAIQETGAPFSAIVIISAEPADTDEAGGDLLTPILDSGTTIHVVANRQPSGAAASSSELLHGLADQTHGQYTTIYSPASFGVALNRLADRFVTEMMIQYVIPAGVKSGGDVRVGVNVPGARVRGLGVRP